MTILTEQNRVDYEGDGFTTQFTYPYRFVAHEDLAVLVTDTISRVTTRKTIDADYTVTGGAGEPGTVTFLVAPSEIEDVAIVNDPPITQPVSFKDLKRFPSSLIESVFDKTVLQLQTFTQALNGALRLPPGSTASAELPPYEAGKYLGWSLTEDELANLDGPVVPTEALTFADGLTRSGADVSVDLASVEPGMEFVAGQLRTLVDDVTVERHSTGIRLKTTEQAVVISGGAITVSQINIAVGTEAAAPTDDLDTINMTALPDGTVFHIRPGVAGQTITIKSGVDNIFTFDGNDADIGTERDYVSFQKSGANAYEVNRSFYPVPAINGVAVSGELTLTASSTAVFAHGLGALPLIVDYVLICKVAELGYLVGEHVPIKRHDQGDSANNAGFSSTIDPTNVNIHFSINQNMVLQLKDGSAWQLITPSSWKLIIRAFA